MSRHNAEYPSVCEGYRWTLRDVKNPNSPRMLATSRNFSSNDLLIILFTDPHFTKKEIDMYSSVLQVGTGILSELICNGGYMNLRGLIVPGLSGFNFSDFFQSRLEQEGAVTQTISAFRQDGIEFEEPSLYLQEKTTILHPNARTRLFTDKNGKIILFDTNHLQIPKTVLPIGMEKYYKKEIASFLGEDFSLGLPQKIMPRTLAKLTIEKVVGRYGQGVLPEIARQHPRTDIIVSM